jgi:hypothetical protein
VATGERRLRPTMRNVRVLVDAAAVESDKSASSSATSSALTSLQVLAPIAALPEIRQNRASVLARSLLTVGSVQKSLR